MGAILTLLVLASWLTDWSEYHHGFDREGWQAPGEAIRKDTADMGNVSTGNRENMVRDLLAHYLKPGMTRAQVVALLGPPERDGVEWRLPDGVRIPDSLTAANYQAFNKWYAAHAQPDTILRYRVGWDIIDPTSLRIQLTGTGKVKRCWVGLH